MIHVLERYKFESLSEDKSRFVGQCFVRFLGIPIFHDHFESSNKEYLNLYDSDNMSNDEQDLNNPDRLYAQGTHIGFKCEKS